MELNTLTGLYSCLWLRNVYRRSWLMGSYDDGRKSLENTHMLICSGRHTL